MTTFIVAIVCLMVGATVGLIVAALCFMARGD